MYGIVAVCRRWCCTALVVLLPQAAWAAVESGPAGGEAVAKLPVQQLNANRFEPTDAVSAAAEKGAVYLFVQAERWDRPMARFMKMLDEKLPDFDASASATAVWLTRDVDGARQYLPRAADSLRMSKTSLSVYDGDVTGPEGWGINPDAFLTVVVAHKGKVVKSFGFVSVNETDVPEVGEVLKRAAGK